MTPISPPPPSSRHLPPPALPATRNTPMLTIAQIAETLQVSDKTIRRWINDGSLVAHRVGAQWRIAAGDLRDFLACRRRVQ